MFSRLRFWFVTVLFLSPGLAQQLAPSAAAVSSKLNDSYGKLPLSFEANQGQTNPQVKFLARGSGCTLFLTQNSAVLSLRHQKAATKANVLRMKLLGANSYASVLGSDGLPGKSNYFVGSNPRQWHTNVSTYAAVKYSGVYPGIDLVYHGNQRMLEYDFIVAPGADPKAIDLRFQGARKLSVNREGALVIGLGDEEVIEPAPVVYQEIGGQRREIDGRFVLRGNGRVGFNVAAYDRSAPLVIDPTLVYSTYLGSWDSAAAIAVDASGNAYIAGAIGSFDLQTSPSAFQPNYGGGGDAIVVKLSADGSALLYSTYLGGSGNDGALGIAVDAAGDAYVAGSTQSSDFPTTPGAFQTTFQGSNNRAFVSKLNATGSQLIYSTYLGGSGGDEASGIAVDAAGDSFVTGSTRSSDFPITAHAFQTSFGTGIQRAFVTRLSNAGSALVYSTYLGGSRDDGATAIAIDALDNAYITGYAGPDFPTTPGAIQTTFGGGNGYWGLDGFVVKLNAAGSALLYSTYLGGSGDDSGAGIAIDTLGNSYVAGSTSSSDFPTTPGAYQPRYGGSGDAFVSKLNATGSVLVYSTYLGGSLNDGAFAIAVDVLGDAFVTGATVSSDFPTTSGAFQSFKGVSDAFVSNLNGEGTALLFSTVLGGGQRDQGSGIAIDSRNIYVVGVTESSDFPTTPGAFQTTFGSPYDAFVSKLSPVASPATTLTLSGPAGGSGWYRGTVTVTLSATAGSAPVSATYYSVDGGAYQIYSVPFAISSDGVHPLLFYSVDTAGNQETPHGQTIKIDQTPPVISGMPGPACTIWPPNKQLVQVATVTATDALSGLAPGSFHVSGISNEPSDPANPDVVITPNGSGGFIIQLRADRLGNGTGRVYTLNATASDIAGNTATSVATCVVPHDQGT